MCRRSNRHLNSASTILLPYGVYLGSGPQHIIVNCEHRHNIPQTLTDFHQAASLSREFPAIAAVGTGRYNAGHGARVNR